MLMNAQMTMHNIMERDMSYGEYKGKQYDEKHGSFFDRGSADSCLLYTSDAADE